MTEAEVAWVAGILEGEGSFNRKNAKTQRVKVAVEMTDSDIISRLHRITGVGTVCAPARRGVWKQSWVWSVQKDADARWLMRQVRPWMGVRRTARIDELLA